MAKKRGLGKGLNALLKADEKENTSAEQVNDIKSNSDFGVQKIDLSKIVPNPDQPRKIFNDEQIKELAETIESNGLINPLTLRLKGDEYQIISGERRFRALKSLGRNEADAIVLDVQDEKMLELTLIENIQRADLNAIEIAFSYRKLIDDFNISHDSLAKRVGRSRSAVTNSMRILELSENIRDMIIQNKITEGHARVLLREKNLDKRESIALEIIEKSLSVRDVENLFKDKVNNSKVVANGSKEKNSDIVLKDANHKKIESDLEKIFATKVNLFSKDSKSGKIVIEYYSPEDLIRIIDILEKDTFKSILNTKKTEVIDY